MMRVLDLFSGIGGFSLGLERAGMKTVAFCEVDPYARRVLAKHWPHVPTLGDITRVDEFPDADIICGGFPCQDISLAGKREGITGLRSGLYREMVRAIRVVRPLYAIMENVAALLNFGMGRVLGDLAAHGYDAEWDCISAGDVGAPHGRDRVWIAASNTDQQQRQSGGQRIGRRVWGEKETAAACDPHRIGKLQPPRLLGDIRRRIDNSASEGIGWPCHWQEQFETFRRMDDGLPTRLDRATVAGAVRCLGNAVVPQIPEMIGRAIMDAVA
jgi:DNA (cytosine-5)-methyltransferase 1